MTRGAGADLRAGSRARISPPAPSAPPSMSPASSPSFTLHAPQGSVPVELHLAGPPQPDQCPGRGGGGQRRRRRPGRDRARPRRHAPGTGPAAVQARGQRRLDHRRFLQRQSEFGAGRNRSAGAAGGPPLAGVRRHGRTGRLRRPRVIARSACGPRPPASNACSPPGHWRSWRWRAFGAGASWFADTRTLAAAVDAELSQMGPNCRRYACWSRVRASTAWNGSWPRWCAPATGSLIVLYLLTQHLTACLLRLQCVLVPDAARHPGLHDLAGVLPADRTIDDCAPVALPDRPGRAR